MERHGKKPGPRTVRLRTPPVESTAVADRIGQLAHEVNNLLDGSMRQLGLVLHKVDHLKQTSDELGDMDRRLKSVYVSMQQLGKIVEQAGNNRVPIGGDIRAGLNIEEAVEHACAMYEQRASVHGISLMCEVSAEAGELPAATLPCLLLNGVKNAIESMTRKPNPGRITIVVSIAQTEAAVDALPRLPAGVVIEITDEGPGLARALEGKDLFSPGVSTKSIGLGIGLCIARQAVQEVDGTLELVPRTNLPGMTLRAFVPLDSLRGRSMDAIIGHGDKPGDTV